MTAQSHERGGQRLIWILVAAAVGAIVSLLVTERGKPLVDTLWGKPRSIASQLDEVRAEARHRGLAPVIDRDVVLHGSTSHLFVFRSTLATDPTVSAPSDEIRIYDEESGELHRRVRFAPRAREFQFALYGVRAFDETDQRQLVGSYERDFPDYSAAYPVAIVWDPARHRYRLAGLLSRPRRLLPAKGAFAYAVRHLYERHILRNRFSNLSVATYGAAKLAFQRKPSARVFAGYVVSRDSDAYHTAYEVVGWSLNFTSPEPAEYICSTRPRHVVRTYDNSRRVDLIAAWKTVKGFTGC
jgi:hypothetical protein